ncbi:glycosyltransferase [Photobacterium damselae]|uniref:glycosyltransferase n=1 Tax=Gammaproteobacteria TaxID=1236 RepID=UPI001EDCAF42|nr:MULTISPECIES: glycosyltransferase [Gammaproteobacteria]MCG3813608.1 glycosyltransferase [Photobacterium damselae]MCG3880736.1 glycosyltransferase [Psychrobacter sp. Ps6]
MKVVAIVVTYNRCDLLKKVISSLVEQTYNIDHIIIVDNDSSDSTSDLVQQILDKYNFISYFNTGDNLGGAGGFNKGFILAEKFDYDYLWLMDDDFVPDKNCLDELIKDSPEGIIQPIRFNLNDTCAEISPVDYNLRRVFCKNPKTKTVVDVYNNRKLLDKINIAGVPFEGPLISKNVVKRVGYPNPDFFIFNDDLDYSIRARKAGFPIVCSFKARAKRLLVNNQSSDLSGWKGYFMLRNHFYILKTYGENIFVCNRPLLITFFYIVLGVFKLDFKLVKTIISAYKDSFSLSNSLKYRP